MSISEKEVKVSEPARLATSPSPYRTITDKELTLVQISCDFVCACIALPLSLVVLSQLSAVPVNASGFCSRAATTARFAPSSTLAASVTSSTRAMTSRTACWFAGSAATATQSIT